MLGVHNYYQYATHITKDMRKIAFGLNRTLKNRLNYSKIYFVVWGEGSGVGGRMCMLFQAKLKRTNALQKEWVYWIRVSRNGH